MSIKYEIQSIKNSKGTGKEQEFVRIFENPPQTDRQLESHIQDNCSLTKGDVQATLITLRDSMMLLAKIKEYLTANNCITRRDLQQNFGLRQSAALKCLKYFTEIGILKKEGARNSPVYFLNK